MSITFHCNSQKLTNGNVDGIQNITEKPNVLGVGRTVTTQGDKMCLKPRINFTINKNNLICKNSWL